MAFSCSRHNLTVIHIPKTGTRSLYFALGAIGAITTEYPNGRHMTIQELKDRYLGENSDKHSDKMKFLVQVRNPYHRFLSCYNHIFHSIFSFPQDIKKLSLKDKGYIEGLSIDSFVDLLTDVYKREEFIFKVNSMIEKKALRQFFDQRLTFSTQCSHIEGHKVQTLRCFKLETRESWTYLRHLGYAVEERHVGLNKYKEVWSLNDKQRDIVYDYFIDDFRRFEYARYSEDEYGLYTHS
tara:strand:- start:12858 stop:13571 length:714 start_codon:yes stop_codon:yes gene_type:complete